MHFTTLYILKNEELDNVNLSTIEEDFSERFCYCCGETRPRYRWWCDWFQIGGRWCDMLRASKGIKGKRSWCNEDEKDQKGHFSVAEIKDLKGKIELENIYAVATKSRIYEGDEEIQKWLDKINNKTFKGVVALIDCHD